MPDDDPITKELWDLALKTPAKHYRMTIFDKTTGLKFVADQSLDSKIQGSGEAITKLINALNGAFIFFEGKKYSDIFTNDDMEKLIIANDIEVTFEGVKGEKALILFNRYVNTLITSLVAKGVISWEPEKEQTE